MEAKQNWRVAPGDAKYVFFEGVARPINCGSAERAQMVAAAPDLLAVLKQARREYGAFTSISGETLVQIDAVIAKAGA